MEFDLKDHPKDWLCERVAPFARSIGVTGEELVTFWELVAAGRVYLGDGGFIILPNTPKDS